MTINDKLLGPGNEDLGVTYKEVFLKLLSAPDNRLNSEGKRACVSICKRIISDEELPYDLTENEILMIRSKFDMITEPFIFVATEDFFNAHLRAYSDCSE